MAQWALRVDAIRAPETGRKESDFVPSSELSDGRANSLIDDMAMPSKWRTGLGVLAA